MCTITLIYEFEKERKGLHLFNLLLLLERFGYNTHIFSINGVFLLIANNQKFLVPSWKFDPEHATGGYMVIFNVYHSLLGEYNLLLILIKLGILTVWV